MLKKVILGVSLVVVLGLTGTALCLKWFRKKPAPMATAATRLYQKAQSQFRPVEWPKEDEGTSSPGPDVNLTPEPIGGNDDLPLPGVVGVANEDDPAPIEIPDLPNPEVPLEELPNPSEPLLKPVEIPSELGKPPGEESPEELTKRFQRVMPRIEPERPNQKPRRRMPLVEEDEKKRQLQKKTQDVWKRVFGISDPTISDKN